MKETMTILLTLLLSSITAIFLITYNTDGKQALGMDISFGWEQVESSGLSQGAVCVNGISPYVRGLPFYASKHDGVHPCEPGMVNSVALFLDVVVAISAVGLIQFAGYKVVKKIRAQHAAAR